MSKKHFITLIVLTFLTVYITQAQKTDLSSKWDTVRSLANPDKGWYHHMLDNGIGKYGLKDESELKAFPGMDHLYLRLAWAYLEPEEGKFDWSYIDNIVEKYVPLGYGISFRISCKETGGKPNSVPEEVNGVFYATPSWVEKAGAKGVVPTQYGSKSWTPDWDDPVFLEKLDNFHRAFAARYDGKPWVRYIDVGSIGEWGEGHTHFSTRIPPSVEEVKANMNIYLKNYKKTQLVVTDDLLYYSKSEKDVKALYDYAVAKGFTLRDDSPMVKYYAEAMIKTWSVSHPQFYSPLYLQKPIVFESEHYPTVKRNGLWLGKNGKDTIPSLGYSGAKIFREAIKLEHATYIGFHGYAGEYLTDNPDFIAEMLNLCGYWYFPKSLTIKDVKKSSLRFDIEWVNKGVAPAYSVYQLKGKLTNIKKPGTPVYFIIQNSGNKNWLPGMPYNEAYSTDLKDKLKGRYSLAIQLFDTRTGRIVELGLKEQLRDSEGYYFISDIKF
jgi:hypothetical protein